MFAKVSPLTGTVDDHAAFVNLAASPLSALHQSAISSLANSGRFTILAVTDVAIRVTQGSSRMQRMGHGTMGDRGFDSTGRLATFRTLSTKGLGVRLRRKWLRRSMMHCISCLLVLQG